jgi:hypothetical protein
MARHFVVRALLSTALVAVVYPPALVAEGGSSFHLSLEPLVFEGLVLDQDTESSKFQEYRDLSEGFRLRLMSLTGLTDDGKRQLDFQILNGGRDDAFYGLSYDVAGSWGLELSYDNIPHRFGNNGKTLWTRTAPGVYEIDDPIQQSLQKAIADRTLVGNVDFAFLNSLIQPFLKTANEIDVGLQRRRSRVALDLGRAGAASWSLEYKQEDRSGTRNLGTSFGFNNVTELPEPIEYKTTDATLAANWKWSKGVFAAGYRYSKFENDVATLYFDNPWRATDSTDPGAYSSPNWTFRPPPLLSSGSIGGSSRGFFDLAPDNDAGILFANGRFDLGSSSWLQMALNWTRLDQDDALLPFTLNTAIAAPPQPHGSAAREAEMLRVVLDYGARFGDGWQTGVR